MRFVTIALAVAALAACTPAAKTETKVASVDSSSQAPMPMGRGMQMGMGRGMQMGMGRGMQGQMMGGGCPLALTSLALSPSQKATFDSVKTEHRAAMMAAMQASLARARAVLTAAQRVTFDSAAASHTAMMTRMMESGGCMQ